MKLFPVQILNYVILKVTNKTDNLWKVSTDSPQTHLKHIQKVQCMLKPTQKFSISDVNFLSMF